MSSAVTTDCTPSEGSVSGHGVQNGALLGAIRIADDQLQHEAIDLRFRQRISAFLLERVLRRENEKRIRQADRFRRRVVTWRSCIASSSALCTFAGARLISSARIRFEKIGPCFVRERAVVRVVDHACRRCRRAACRA